MLDARSFMISTLRSQVGFAAAVMHLPRAPSFRISQTAFDSRRGEGGSGEALWERVEAGSGSLGAASSESAAGSGRLRACGGSCCG